MGYAIARAAEYRGADVLLISGPTALATPAGVRRQDVTTAREMADAVLAEMDGMQVIIKVAAVADYRPDAAAEQKIKKTAPGMTLAMEKNIDILKEAGQRKKDQILVGFAAETQDLDQNAQKKLEEKNLDLIAGNLVGNPASGFGTDTNQVTLYYPDGTSEKLSLMEKDEVAHILLDRIGKMVTRHA
jgi:phosphopantothenoylcysteine decarboxylase/phosphopantothenate--cysteine ligase